MPFTIGKKRANSKNLRNIDKEVKRRAEFRVATAMLANFALERFDVSTLTKLFEIVVMIPLRPYVSLLFCYQNHPQDRSSNPATETRAVHQSSEFTHYLGTAIEVAGVLLVATGQPSLAGGPQKSLYTAAATW